MVTWSLQTADPCHSYLSNCAKANSEAPESKKFQSLNVNRLKDNRDAKTIEKGNLLLYVCLQIKNTTNPQHGATLYVVTVRNNCQIIKLHSMHMSTLLNI